MYGKLRAICDWARRGVRDATARAQVGDEHPAMRTVSGGGAPIRHRPRGAFSPPRPPVYPAKPTPPRIAPLPGADPDTLTSFARGSRGFENWEVFFTYRRRLVYLGDRVIRFREIFIYPRVATRRRIVGAREGARRWQFTGCSKYHSDRLRFNGFPCAGQRRRVLNNRIVRDAETATLRLNNRDIVARFETTANMSRRRAKFPIGAGESQRFRRGDFCTILPYIRVRPIKKKNQSIPADRIYSVAVMRFISGYLYHRVAFRIARAADLGVMDGPF